MSEQIKISDQEMQEIRDLQTKFQEKITEFGRFRIEHMQLFKLAKDLEAKELKSEEEFKVLQTKEKDLLDRFTKKYGDGQLNLSNGDFIPISNVQGIPRP